MLKHVDEIGCQNISKEGTMSFSRLNEEKIMRNFV